MKIFGRGSGKTGIQFIHMLEELKKNSKTKKEKEYYEIAQKEWSEYIVGSTLGFWKNL